MANLYELCSEIDRLNEQLQAAEDAGDNSAADCIITMIEALGLEADAKLSAIWRWMKNLEAEGAMYAEEAKRLQEMKRSRERRYDSLKAYVATCLQPGQKWQEPGGVAAFGWRKSEACEVVDPDAVPDCYCVFERKPVLSEIKKDRGPLLKGEIPGVKLVSRQNLQVQ